MKWRELGGKVFVDSYGKEDVLRARRRLLQLEDVISG